MANYPQPVPPRRLRLLAALDDAKSFQLCSPSADPEYITGKTVAYRKILTQIQRLASPLLSPADADLLGSLVVAFDDIYTVYDASAVLEAMIPDIELVLESLTDADLASLPSTTIIEPSVIEQFDALRSPVIDCAFMARVCREINACYSHGHNIAALLLMRTLLNAVPQVFGCESFQQVVASSGRSLKPSFEHLENGLRKIADFHAHSMAGPIRPYPTGAQVEPFKPQFEQLLHEVLARTVPG